MDQNTPVPPPLPVVHDGYLSEESKKRFTITAGILGAVFFFLQFLAPFFMMMLIFPTFMLTSFKFKEYDFSRAAVLKNDLYFFTEESGPPNMRNGSAKLMRLNLDKIPVTELKRKRSILSFPGASRKDEVELEEIAEISGDLPWIVPNGERLLLISQSKMEEVRNGEIIKVDAYGSLGNISRPFYYEGSPAVLEGRPDGIFLTVYENGVWTRTQVILDEDKNAPDVDRHLQVLAVDDVYHVFLRSGKALFHRIGIPLTHSDSRSNEWMSVTSSAREWQSFVLDGKPAIMVYQKDSLRAYHYEKGKWSKIMDTPTGTFPAESFVPLPPVGGSLRMAVP